MCIAPGTTLFYAGLALGAALCVQTVFNAMRLWRAIAAANDSRSWTEVMHDHGPVMVVNTLWLYIFFIALRGCGVF